MFKLNVGMKIASGYFLALVTLAVIGFFGCRSVVKLMDTAEWVTRAHQVLESLEGVVSGMKDVETGSRGYVITGDEKFLEPYNKGPAHVTEALQLLHELIVDPAQKRRLASLEMLVNTKLTVAGEVIETRRDKTKGFEQAQQMVMSGRGKKAMDEIRASIEEMRLEEVKILEVRRDEARAMAEGSIWAGIYATVAALVLMFITGVMVTRSIAVPLREIAVTAERIAGGDLSTKPWVSERGDEVGVLSRSFVRMSLMLRSQVSELVEGIHVLGASANEISASTTQLASSAEQSMTSVSETTTTVEEVRQTAEVATQKARLVSETTQRSAAISLTGRKSSEDVALAMGRISQQVDAIATNMGKLSEQSQAIGQIIATVEDLAIQSNLLAVNAAIEAAKAGEHGKGFSVVAHEVKSLAEQSRQATNQVRSLLGDIQKATTAAVMSTEQGSKSVDAGIRQTGVTADAISQLAMHLTEAAQSATQIAASSQQQLVGVDQVVLAMENIKQGASQNVASAKQLEVAARSLSELGQKMAKLVSHYKLQPSSHA